MATSSPIWPPGKLNHLRFLHLVTEYGRRVLFKVFDKSFLYAYPKTITDILQDNGVSLGWDDPDCPFYPSELRILLSNKDPRDFDVTLLNRICEVLWEEGVSDPGEELKDCIWKIKTERNKVCHNVEKISEASLEKKIHYFKLLLDNTILKAKSAFPSYCSEMDLLQGEIQEACSKIVDKIREPYDPKNNADVEKFQEEIESFGRHLYGYIQELSLGDLKSSCDGPCKILPYDWLPQCETTDPSEFAVALKLDGEKEFSMGFSILNSCTVDQNDILETKNQKGENPKAVLISGNAGTGKTTLLCSTAQKWRKGANDMKDLPSFKTLLYMQFRDGSCDNFEDYLRSLLPLAVSLFDMKHIRASILGSRVLILCDGFDERNNNTDKLFKEMLTLCSHNNGVKIIVTTRPTNTENLTHIVNSAKLSRVNLSILGLTRPNMVFLIGNVSRYLVDDETRRQDVEKGLSQALEQMDEKIMDILKTPLYFNLFVLLYIQCPDVRKKVTSVTELFIQLEEHKRRRILSTKQMSMDTLKQFEKRYENQSLDHYINKKFEWSEEDVSKLKSEISQVSQELEENFDYIMSAYLNIKYIRKGLIPERVFCLRHRSEQEFVVARIISEEIINSGRRNEKGIVQRVLSSKDIKADPVLLMFITGVLYHSNRQIFEETVDQLFELASTFMFKDNASRCYIDPMLALYAEVNHDPKSLESLAQVLRRKSVNRIHEINEASSLKSLNSLMPRLPESRGLWINIGEYLGREVQSLRKTLLSISSFWHKTSISMAIHLEDLHLAESTGQEVITVNGLCLKILDMGGPLSLLQIPSFPVRGKRIIVQYMSKRKDFGETCEAVNRLWPSRGNATAASPSSQDTFSQQSSLFLIFNHCTPDDARTVLESLTVQPLMKMAILSLREEDKILFISQKRDLEELCLRQQLGIFIFLTRKECFELSRDDRNKLLYS